MRKEHAKTLVAKRREQDKLAAVLPRIMRTLNDHLGTVRRDAERLLRAGSQDGTERAELQRIASVARQCAQIGLNLEYYSSNL